jgi:hypothetical protein
MTTQERKEHRRLTDKWARGKADMGEMARCMVLDRKDSRERREERERERVRS